MSIDTPQTPSADDVAIDELERLFAITPDTQGLLFRNARSAIAFTDDPVTDAQIRAAYDLVRWGPTAMNSTPLRLLLVRSPEGRERLADLALGGNQERIRKAPLSLVLASDTGFHHTLGTLAPHLAGIEERFEADPEGRAAMARDSAHIQAGYLIVALRSLGLDVGPMSGIDAAAVDAEFFTEGPRAGWRSLLVLTVGVAAGPDAYRPRASRLDYDEVSATV